MLLLVVLLGDVVVTVEVAAVDKADVVVTAVEEIDLDAVEENSLPKM